jgi:hypothetical protein
MTNINMKASVDDLVLQAQRWRSTQLGVGVVSRNVVDVTIEIAKRHRVMLMLVASRRQVDLAALGGGYVCGWTAHDLAEYVSRRGAAEWILLARDHGGPWQHQSEVDGAYDEDAAMRSAMASFQEDIDAGFSIIHLDPSTSLDGEPPEDLILDRMLQLYDACSEYARSAGREIAFEVGSEEQVHVHSSIERPRRMLDRLREHCARSGQPMPLFAVVQTGTKVLERRNVGSLDAPYRIEGQLPAEIFIPQVLSMLREFGVRLKQHNTDYLSSEVLGWHPRLGIDAANIAPQYGVDESLGLIELLEGTNCRDLSDRFLELSYSTRKWEKWMVPGSLATDREKAIWSGHYVFSDPAFEELKNEANSRLAKADIDVDDVLRTRLDQLITSHVRAFRLALD